VATNKIDKCDHLFCAIIQVVHRELAEDLSVGTALSVGLVNPAHLPLPDPLARLSHGLPHVWRLLLSLVGCIVGFGSGHGPKRLSLIH
jgi:hypothetical protein